MYSYFGDTTLARAGCKSGKIGARMPTSARTSLGFFGQFADVGIRAPEQNGLLQQALVSDFRFDPLEDWRNYRPHETSVEENTSRFVPGRHGWVELRSRRSQPGRANRAG